MSVFLGKPPASIETWIYKHRPTPPTSGPLCFTAEEANSTVKFGIFIEDAPIAIAEFYPDMNLQYSIDGSNWTVMDLTLLPSDFTLANVGDKIYFKAVTENPVENWSYGYQNPSCKWKMTGKIAASGNIQYLLKSDGSRTDVPNLCYDNMFSYCTSLTSAPQLPATLLASYCYRQMFFNCTSLTLAPQLPASLLADNCYSGMFLYCTSLTQAPELPATTLANCCYNGMFIGCTEFSDCHMKASMEGVYNKLMHGDTSKTVIYDL